MLKIVAASLPFNAHPIISQQAILDPRGPMRSHGAGQLRFPALHAAYKEFSRGVYSPK